MSVCHHCGHPRTGCLKGLCLGGEACELQARLNEADGTIGELRQRISALETLAHAAIELRSYKLTVPAEVFARFDAAVKGVGL